MNRRTFTIVFHGGWGARLIMLGGAYIFAKRHDRELRFYWNHRFACPWKTFTSTPAEELDTEKFTYLRKRAAVAHYKYGLLAWTDENGSSDIPELAVSAIWTPQALGISAKAAVEELKRQVDFSRVEQIADNCHLPAPIESCIGVHVRRGTSFDPVFPEANEFSPTQLFAERMNEEDDQENFFLCTDSDEERAFFERSFNAFGSKLPTGRYHPETHLNDLAEIILLSRCKSIIGGYGSSFARLAALYGEKPFEVLSTISPESCPWW